MNLPNKLTLLRVLLIPFFLLFMYLNIPFHFAIALVIFGIASITDALDGRIARSRNLVTNFGKFLDPLADKVLVIAALAVFVEFAEVNMSAIPFIIITAREFMVSGLRLLAANSGIVVAAGIWGKLKTAFTMVAIVAILLWLSLCGDLREKIGVMYGNPETTPGGRALKFYSSVRIEVRKGEVIKSGTDVIGACTRCKIVKNKVAPPFKECEFDLMYGSGISRTGEVLDLAVDLDIIKKGGSWFSYKDQKLGQGRDNVKELLQNDENLMKEIEEQILARKDELKAAAPKKSKPAEAVSAADKPVSGGAAVSDDDVLASFDENFEEFTPAEE